MIVQETLRWGPATSLAVPQTCLRDDNYNGYCIPKGAIILGNVWAMTRDETVYKNPEVDPDRFLDSSTPPSPVFAIGWGHRRCPGTNFAEASLFLTIASILTTFNIGLAQDENGKDIFPSGKMNSAMLLTPQNFVFKLTPRSTSYEELLLRNP
ncbi:unnamed protein product [Rhizoctonia solani]|uniref:O-methylsterigmatocystin oxidoreductase n=1 Tax=Rhizoctonia solani TaxID=456999 RepID=A0A8H2X5X8_9AGAM|nr:unnamed protein product [Rhizoctonia solani]